VKRKPSISSAPPKTSCKCSPKESSPASEYQYRRRRSAASRAFHWNATKGEGKYVQIRGTEPRLSSVTVNGVNLPSPEGAVRNIKLDAVPADLVERIEVFKTLSANQYADGVGGTVNLVTRTAGEKAHLCLGGTGGYNPIQNGYGRGGFLRNPWQALGTSKKLGFLPQRLFDKTNRGIDDLEPSQTVLQDASHNSLDTAALIGRI